MIRMEPTSMIWNGGEITKDMYTEVQQGLIRGAEKIAQRARQLVPVGDLSKHPKNDYTSQTLHLKDTIRAKGRRKRRGEKFVHGIVSGIYETALPGAWVFAGDRDRYVYWAHMVEWGTYDKPAHPFLRPAADSNFDAVLAEAEHAGQRVINKRRRARAARRRARA